MLVIFIYILYIDPNPDYHELHPRIYIKETDKNVIII